MVLVENFKSDSVFIYSPGRSGSTYCKWLFKEAKLNVYNIHSLKPGKNIDRIKNNANNYIRQQQRAFLNHFQKNKVKILILVRDPIMRCLSSHYKHFIKKRVSVKEETVNFISTFPYQWTLDWFDNEIKNFLGIDVYESDFDKIKKYKVIDSKYSLLILRTDSINTELKQLVKAHWGISNQSLSQLLW